MEKWGRQAQTKVVSLFWSSYSLTRQEDTVPLFILRHSGWQTREGRKREKKHDVWSLRAILDVTTVKTVISIKLPRGQDCNVALLPLPPTISHMPAIDTTLTLFLLSLKQTIKETQEVKCHQSTYVPKFSPLPWLHTNSTVWFPWVWILDVKYAWQVFKWNYKTIIIWNYILLIA